MDVESNLDLIINFVIRETEYDNYKIQGLVIMYTFMKFQIPHCAENFLKCSALICF